MTSLLFLIPVSLCLGGMGLAAFLWALNSGQYEDLEGAALRVLDDADVEPAGAARRIRESRD
jgi:cbb3-type cytochrome oxidase maturation protein